MKCPNCKKEVAKGSVFCEYCGAKLPRRKLRITIMVIMLLLITIPLVYYKYNQTQQKREENRVLELRAAEDARLKAAANGYKYVDLGLPSGVRWAACNVGASSPEEYGKYYAWGEIATKKSYKDKNSITYGKAIDDISGNPEYDVANANWGGSWRLPTKSEMDELKNKCTWTWTTQGANCGYKVTGPNGNSIFLPVAGYYGLSLKEKGYRGYYWTSTPSDDNSAYHLNIKDGSVLVYTLHRHYGRSVRPVIK